MGKIKKRKIRFIVGWLLLLVITAFSAVMIADVCSRDISMVLLVDGKEICAVKNRMTVDEALVILDMRYKDSGIVKQMGNTISYGYSLSDSRDDYTAEEISEMIYETSASRLSRAYYVSVGEKDIAACRTYSDAKRVADELTGYITERIGSEDGDEGEIRLTTDISVRNGFCLNSSIAGADEVLAALLNVGMKESGGKDSEGERISAFGDPGLSESGNGRNKSAGEAKELLSGIGYRRIVTEEVTEIVSPEVEYVESDKVYIGTTQILYEGESGISRNIYETVFEKGEEILRRLVRSEIISASKNKVVLIGTKHYPAPVPTGTFSWPIKKSYVISSYYSENRGKLDRGVGYHLGIDIAGYEIKVGEPVYAADGGEVIYAAKLGTYGNLIRIKHEEGVETYYAHLSKFYVAVGDKVYKGQKIGEVGMTGQTSGPHLHFEVRIDGQTTDPLLYLPKKK